jgi:hypothetical protein
MAEIRTAALMCTSCLGGRFACAYTCACVRACPRAGGRACRRACAAKRSQAQPCGAVRSRASVRPCVRANVCTRSLAHTRVCVHLRVCLCVRVSVSRLCPCLSVSVSVCVSLHGVTSCKKCLRNGDFQPLGVSEFPCRCLQSS